MIDFYKKMIEPTKRKFCARCLNYTLHRQRFDKESGWTYFACDNCEFSGEEVVYQGGLRDE